MALRTQLFQLLPWVGGVNTSQDPAMIPQAQLVQADNCVFGTRGSRKKRDGINQDWDDASNGSDSILELKDFWYGTAAGKTQKLLAVTSGKKIHTYNTSGARSADLFAGTAWGSAITQCDIQVLNQLAIIAVDGTSNVPKKYDGSSVADLGGSPQAFSFSREHQGRLWTNDKANVDRLYYSTTGNPEQWGGTGDSGALDIGIGDGDPDGITAIFPTFKGDLFVAKRTKLYRVTGDAPENYKVSLVSNGIGCVSHGSVAAIDENDVVFVSERGIHSLSATDTYGDFEGAYISKDIQTTFNEDFTASRLKFIKAAYLNQLNSVAFAVTDETYNATANNALWLYNIEYKGWYRWANQSCQALAVVKDSDKKRFYLGSNTTRVYKTLNGTNYDLNTSGTSTAITFTIKTGLIAPDQNFYVTKGFKKFILFYRPVGTHQITASIKIDNYEAQGLSFSETGTAALLGSSFTLGSSTLGYTSVFAPYTQSLDGFGRSFQLTLTQSGTDQEVEIQGFGVEYEAASTQQETVTDVA